MKISRSRVEAPSNDDQEFVPRGAIAFFAAMIAFFSVVWLAVYALMIQRH